MSWSVQVTETPAEDFVTAINHAEVPSTYFSPDEYAAVLEQLDVAKVTAIRIFASGVLGPTTEGTYVAFLSGHANPNHQPRDGYCGDTVAVNAYRLN